MRESRPTRPFVLRADMIPLIHVNDRELSVDVKDKLDAVGKHKALKGKRREGRGHGGLGDMGDVRCEMGNVR